MQQSNHCRPAMIPLLLLCLVSLSVASSPPATDDKQGHWKVLQDDGEHPCILFNAQIDLKLGYITTDDSTAEDVDLLVPADSTTTGSSCFEQVVVVEGEALVDSQVLQLNFPHNEGWNVRIYFTQDPRLGVNSGDYAVYQVTVSADYTTMKDLFKNADHQHNYTSKIDFSNPPELAVNELAKIGDSIYCPKSPQGYIINDDPHNGPNAYVRLSNMQFQAYMLGTDTFGKPITCAEDQDAIDIVPVIVSAVLAALVLFTLIAYFVYRSRLPSDILDMTQPEFEEEEEHHHHHKEENNNLNHHDNYGYNENDHRF